MGRFHEGIRLRPQDTAVTVDGLRFRDAATTQGDATPFLQDLVLLGTERIEVLRGPQGVSALLDKRREVRQLEEQNAAKAAENERRRERIHRLEQNSTEQELEIRKQLKLLRPGETTFILEDPPKAPANSPRQP